jgi:hypothetical protein
LSLAACCKLASAASAAAVAMALTSAPTCRSSGKNLPADCLLSLVVSQRNGGSSYPALRSASEQVTLGPGIWMAMDAEQKRVMLNGWGELSGVHASLIIALAAPFRRAVRDELAPEHYPFTKASELMRRTNCSADETLRRRILRCRSQIADVAKNVGSSPPSLDAAIENNPWRGYRLNPDRIRLVAPSELEEPGHASQPKGHASRAKGHASHPKSRNPGR